MLIMSLYQRQSAVCVAVWAGNAMSTSIAHFSLSRLLSVSQEWIFTEMESLVHPLQRWLRRRLGRGVYALRIVLDNTMADIRVCSCKTHATFSSLASVSVSTI